MARTKRLIASQTLGFDTATVTFSSLPQTFDDLVLVVSARSAASANNWYVLIPTLNGDTTPGNYSSRMLYGFSTTAASATSPVHVGYVTSDAKTANTFGDIEIYIPNYAGSANKSMSSTSVTEGNSATLVIMGAVATLWSSASAVTSISLALDSSANLKSGSSFQIYGISHS